MTKPNKDIKKSRVRSKTTRTRQPQLVRMPEAQIAAVDKWRVKVELSRPEAIRRLVDLGLKVKRRP